MEGDRQVDINDAVPQRVELFEVVIGVVDVGRTPLWFTRQA